jgi:hypothetical protein
MLTFLREAGKLSEPKLRLFGVACSRRIWPLLSAGYREAVEVAEKAGGHVNLRQVPPEAAESVEGWWLAEPSKTGLSLAAEIAAEATANEVASKVATEEQFEEDTWRQTPVWREAHRAERAAQAVLLRDLFNPFHPGTVEPSVLTWNAGVVAKMAERIYQARLFDDLSVVRDALLDAGCNDTELLEHLAVAEGHVVGCWALDALTGRS